MGIMPLGFPLETHFGEEVSPGCTSLLEGRTTTLLWGDRASEGTVSNFQQCHGSSHTSGSLVLFGGSVFTNIMDWQANRIVLSIHRQANRTSDGQMTCLRSHSELGLEPRVLIPNLEFFPLNVALNMDKAKVLIGLRLGQSLSMSPSQSL